MIIRPIRADERSRFTALHDPSQGKLLAEHLDEAFASNSTSEQWCLVAERHDRWLGRVFLRGPIGLGEIFVHFFDVAVDEPDGDVIAQDLIDAALAAVAPDDKRTMLYALDVDHPWHAAPGRRRHWFETAGFKVAREAQRWEWPQSRSPAKHTGRLLFRALDEVGEVEFRGAIARVSDGTLDARLQDMRTRLGREEDAAEHFRMLTALRYHPSWFQLAYADRELVGLIAAAGGVDVVFVAYVGVVPEMRGHGYVDDLLAQGTALLVDAGETVIRADTDAANTPMGNAFKRAGYLPFMTRTEFVMSAEERRHRLDSVKIKRPLEQPIDQADAS
jgi:RimJ/RimL family protein N-acetyltransferase